MSTTSVSSSATTTTSIDVASIVSQLMTIANKPLDKVNSQISNVSLVVSDLGTLKSKLATFQTALTTFQSPSTFNTVAASSNNATSVSASATSGTAQGRYSVSVAQTAEASNISISGFTSPTTASVPLTGTNGFTIQVGSKEYSSNTTYSLSSSPATKGGTVAALTSPVSLNTLNAWVNSIATNTGALVSSSVVQTGTNAHALVLNGTQTGVSNAISFSGLSGGSTSTTLSTTSTGSVPAGANVLTTPTNGSGSPQVNISVNSSARDAVMSVNGLQVQRLSNSISDVVSGLTFNLLTPVVTGATAQTALVTVGAGTDNSGSAIASLITTYNDVIAQYKSMTANSTNNTSGAVGSFGNSPGVLSFINEMKLMIANGGLTSNNSVISLGSMGINLGTDGTMSLDKAKLATAQANGLLATLSGGVKVGAKIGSTSNLSNLLSTFSDPGGTIYNLVNLENNSLIYLQKKATSLESRLAEVQKNYTSQYSNLNTLLYNLSQTSSQLTSSLTAITNMNAGN